MSILLHISFIDDINIDPSSDVDIKFYLSADNDNVTTLPKWTKYSIYSTSYKFYKLVWGWSSEVILYYSNKLFY
jgi:hypothetical protein